MALVIADRVRETTTTSGTGTITLAGAYTGFQAFSVIGNGNTTYYAIVDAQTGSWEVGVGTYTLSGTTLSRDTVLASSNSGSLVNFASGTKDVICTQPAERAVFLDSATNATIPGMTLSGGTANGVTYLNGSKVLTSGSALTFDGTSLGVGFTANSRGGVVMTTTNNSGASEQGGYTVTNGNGTGLFSGVNGASYSTGGIGNANNAVLYTIGNTDLVFGRNTSEGMRLTSTGLGIGTSSPVYKLTVNAVGGSATTLLKSDQATADLYLQSSGTTYSYSVGIGASANAMRFMSGSLGTTMLLDSSGNLGLGVTPSAWVSYRGLQNGAASVANYNNADNSFYASNLYYGGSPTDFRFITAGDTATMYRQLSGAHTWHTTGTTTGSANGVASLTQAMTLDASGRLLIGTTAASGYKLDLYDSGGNLAAFYQPDGTYNRRLLITATASGANAGITLNATSSTAGDNLIFQTASAEKARIDSSGNLGLGVTPSASSTSARVLQIRNSLLEDNVNGYAILRYNDYYDGSSDRYISTGAASAFQMQGGAFKWYTAPSGTAGNAISFTQAMTLDASGNLGIGTTSPSSFDSSWNRLVVGTGSGDAGQTIYAGSASTASIAFADGTSGAQQYAGLIRYLHASDAMTFWTGAAERARIDSSGNLLLGTTTGGAKLCVDGSASTSSRVANICSRNSGDTTYAAGLFSKQDNDNSTSQVFVQFSINSDTITSGQINANGANQAAFGSWSDARLKENIVELPPQLSNLLSLRPVEFDYIASEGGGHQIGFIAQEMEAVYPDAVGERSDGMKTISGWSKTEARLVKAIQEQQAIIDSLKARLDAANL